VDSGIEDSSRFYSATYTNFCFLSVITRCPEGTSRRYRRTIDTRHQVQIPAPFRWQAIKSHRCTCYFDVIYLVFQQALLFLICSTIDHSLSRSLVTRHCTIADPYQNWTSPDSRDDYWECHICRSRELNIRMLERIQDFSVAERAISHGRSVSRSPLVASTRASNRRCPWTRRWVVVGSRSRFWNLPCNYLQDCPCCIRLHDEAAAGSAPFPRRTSVRKEHACQGSRSPRE